MHPFRDYPTLTIPELETELCEICSMLADAIRRHGVARANYEQDNVHHYWESEEESHAARQRWADRMTIDRRSDMIEFEQLVAAYQVSYDTLTNLLSWRRSEHGLESASRL